MKSGRIDTRDGKEVREKGDGYMELDERVVPVEERGRRKKGGGKER